MNEIEIIDLLGKLQDVRDDIYILGNIKSAQANMENIIKELNLKIKEIKVNEADTSKEKALHKHGVNACLKSGWIYEFDEYNIVCILRKDGELDEELTVARNLLTKEQNDMVCTGAMMRLDKQTGAVQFMLKDGLNWR